MAVVDNTSGITVDSTGQHNNSKLLDGLPAAIANGQATRYEQVFNGPNLQQNLCVPNKTKLAWTDHTYGTVPVNNSAIPGESGVACSTAAAATFGTNTTTESGVAILSTGASATGVAFFSSSGSNLPYGLSSANPFYFSCKVMVPVLSTTGVQQFKGFWGLNSTVADVSGTSGVGFWNDQSSDTHWMIVMGAGTMTPVATTVTLTAGQWYHLEIVKLAGTTSVDFYVDGVNVGTISTNFPSAQLGLNVGIKKSVGTTASLWHNDWFYFVESIPAKRNASFLA